MCCNFRTAVILIISAGMLRCSPSAYLPDYSPKFVVYRQEAGGGIARQVGSELNPPDLVLLADGSLIFTGYSHGQRALMEIRLDRKLFHRLISDLSLMVNTIKNAPLELRREDDVLPGLRILFFNDTLTLLLPVSTDSLTAEGRIYNALRRLEVYRQSDKAKPYRASCVRLYVKSLKTGNRSQIPRWPFRELAPDTLVREQVGYYEPNTEKNSIFVSGSLARSIQKHMPQSGLYYKYVYQDQIYLAGYRPILP